MKFKVSAVLIAAVVGIASLVSGNVCANAATAATGGKGKAPALATNSYHSSGTLTGGRSVYNYVPTVMQDGVYRMWWCGSGHPGDNILYAESTSLNGPFHAHDSRAPFQVVFSPAGSTGWDRQDACDPSVIRVNSTYYLYYGAQDETRGAARGVTAIGVARSLDGIHWTRLNNGKPIVTSTNAKNTGNYYGAGQPSVTYVNGYFYMIYTDSMGAGAGPSGGGQFVLRSKDPTFQSDTQTLTAAGFKRLTAANRDSYRLLSAISVDWQYSDALRAFIVAHQGANDTTTLSFYGLDFKTRPYADVSIRGATVGGPGIVSSPDRHAVAPTNSDCGTVPINIVRSTIRNRGVGAPNHFQDVGLSVSSRRSCASMPASQVAAIFDGYALEAPGLPLMLDVGGRRLQSASRAPIEQLTKNFIRVAPAVFHAIPYGASLPVGARVISAMTRRGKRTEFVLPNHTRWPINCAGAVAANHSVVRSVSLPVYQSYPVGYSLHCVS